MIMFWIESKIYAYDTMTINKKKIYKGKRLTVDI